MLWYRDIQPKQVLSSLQFSIYVQETSLVVLQFVEHKFLALQEHLLTNEAHFTADGVKNLLNGHT